MPAAVAVASLARRTLMIVAPDRTSDIAASGGGGQKEGAKVCLRIELERAARRLLRWRLDGGRTAGGAGVAITPRRREAPKEEARGRSTIKGRKAAAAVAH